MVSEQGSRSAQGQNKQAEQINKQLHKHKLGIEHLQR
jgi:hypothetical protein